eukprot:gene27590-34333_t
MSFLNNSEKSTIFITGGASGIGLALAVRLLALGHVVIVAGRRQSVLDQAQNEHPELKTIQGDIGSDASRVALFEKVVKEYPDVNVLINNAGVLNASASPLKDTTAEDWEGHKSVIDINLVGTIHLSILFLPHLATKPRPLIVNNTSILAFIPVAVAATYSATKAALHSFTISLRHQLKASSIQVVEICPPTVQTDMGSRFGGMPLDLYADDTMSRLLRGEEEISYEGKYIRASRDELDAASEQINSTLVGL